MTAWDYWFDRAESEMLAAGARGIAPHELTRKCGACSSRAYGGFYYCPAHRIARSRPERRTRQLRATGATSGPRSSSGSKEGSGQL